MTMTFLDYWKEAVRLAGPEHFTVTVGEINEAIDKNQLRPNVDAVKQRLKTATKGEALFLASLFSFFNADYAKKLLTKLGHPNVGDLASKLDRERKTILAGLIRTYEGW